MTGRDSERPITRALGTPQRGQTMAPDVERLAMEIFLIFLDAAGREKDSTMNPQATYKLKYISR